MDEKEQRRVKKRNYETRNIKENNVNVFVDI